MFNVTFCTRTFTRIFELCIQSVSSDIVYWALSVLIMVDSGPSINDISTIIRQKERELHDIHERRCIHLEKVGYVALACFVVSLFGSFLCFVPSDH